MRRNLRKYSVRRMIALSSLKFIALGALTFLLSTGTAFGTSRFPIVDTERSTSDILDSYIEYLRFTVEVGKNVDRNTTAKLVKTFESLKRKNPRGAALFLKGLRFEMLHKVELMGREPSDISISNTEYRKWVGRYLKEWVREADEYLFRAYSASKSELALAE